MPLSWNEIRDRAIAFSREWAEESAEDAEAKSFWDGFFRVFGLERRRIAQFEAPVRLIRSGGKTATGFVDLFWKGRLLVEHKSRGKDLDRAYEQAVDYFEGIADRDLPRFVLVSDFARFRLDDLDTGERHEFTLRDLPKNLRLFGFIAGYESRPVRPQDPINLRAAERMGKLHDRLKASGYEGHDLELALVRLLFCLFADDTGIFQPVQSFRDWIENRTAVDGSDLGAKLTQFFQVLNTPLEKRQKQLDEDLAAFPYVNGKLFEERLSIPAFDAAMRTDLLDAAGLDWSRISPAIFGALFQSVMDPKARRNLGAHYTSEENILKVIEPLFLDDLKAELAAAKGNANKLFEFQKKLRSLTFLDPACGCGNFLVVAYRELRELELEALREVNRVRRQSVDIVLSLKVNVDQFYGIEIEEFPAQIAQVALWLTDHQMNQKVSAEFGLHFARLPLITSPTIIHANALRVRWESVAPIERVTHILGNPPFVGARVMNRDQKADLLYALSEFSDPGSLDYVAAWYAIASKLASDFDIRVAFVSTNSISQGEQPAALWPEMWRRGMKIRFAHRTFRWDNESPGVAAVHCVIIGFGREDPVIRTIFAYESLDGQSHSTRALNINPYLADAPDVLLASRSEPISKAPAMVFGNMPNDGGALLLSDDDKRALLASEPEAAPWVRPFLGAEDFLNAGSRWCLWLPYLSPSQLKSLPLVSERVMRVKRHRSSSRRTATRRLAATPTLFGEIRQPETNYLVVPRHSSEARRFIPMAVLSAETICGDSNLLIPGATALDLGLLQSTMHMAWVRYTCGRLKSDFRYSKDIVYNNFPWPENPSEKQREAIENGANEVLAAREEYPGATLAELYDPLTMPPALVKAHQKLDKAVDAAYGYKGKPTDAERVAFLFELYQKYTSLFPAQRRGGRKRQASRSTP